MFLYQFLSWHLLTTTNCCNLVLLCIRLVFTCPDILFVDLKKLAGSSALARIGVVRVRTDGSPTKLRCSDSAWRLRRGFSKGMETDQDNLDCTYQVTIHVYRAQQAKIFSSVELHWSTRYSKCMSAARASELVRGLGYLWLFFFIFFFWLRTHSGLHSTAPPASSYAVGGVRATRRPPFAVYGRLCLGAGGEIPLIATWHRMNTAPGCSIGHR